MYFVHYILYKTDMVIFYSLDMVIVNLIKSQEKDWSHITETEKRLSDSKKLPETGKSDDPSEGIMSIMKNMYVFKAKLLLYYY